MVMRTRLNTTFCTYVACLFQYGKECGCNVIKKISSIFVVPPVYFSEGGFESSAVSHTISSSAVHVLLVSSRFI